MLILDERTLKIISANKAALSLYGFSEDEFNALTFENLWDQKNKKSFSDFNENINYFPGKHINAFHLKKDGNIMSVDIVGSHLIFDGMKTIYVMIADETERKLIEQIVHESEQRFRILFEGAPDAVILINSGGDKILDSNPAALKLFQRSANELSKLCHWDIYAEDRRESIADNIKVLFSEKNSVQEKKAVESEIVLPGGTRIPVEISLKLTAIGNRPVLQCIFREISLRKSAEEALKKSEDRLKRAQKISNIGSWELNLRTGIIFGNEVSSLIYGFEDYINSVHFDEIKALAHPDDRKYLDEAMQSLIYNNGDFDVKFRIYKKNSGELRTLESKAELIRDLNRKPVKILGIIRDITEISNYQEQLIFEREAAEKSDKLKSEFLAQMSHEIRSPVNIIMSYATLVKDELSNNADEDIRSCFNAIDNGGKRLIRTIDLILNMADIQSGKYETFMEHTDLENDILQNLISEYSNAVKEKGLKIVFQNELGYKKILVDRYTISQIFSNLIDNAIKYTNEGEISVKIKEENDLIKVIVSDTGIGISKEYIPHIFDPFSQEDHGYTRRFEGTGLGLSLVKKYCDLNGAEIGLESIKGKGTVFTVSLRINTENQLLAAYSNI